MTDPTTAGDELRPQHLDAIERATLIRSRRAILKQRVAAGELPVADLLRCDLDDETDRAAAGSLPVGDALRSVRRVGRSASRRILNAVEHGPIPEQKRVRDLTDRQVAAIVAVVAQVAPWAGVAA